jgi:uncharacterized protein (DUF983 family)
MATFKLSQIGKCPICNQGHVFADHGNVFLMRVPKMNERCSVCNYKFDKEPGYFFGAMYLSYAMAIAEMIAVFLCLVWFVPTWALITALLCILVLMSFYNYRLSREIWVKLFPY